MTKTLQSNKQSEVDAESVPSSLRIVCDDASSINLQAAETAEEGKPRRNDNVARWVKQVS